MRFDDLHGSLNDLIGEIKGEPGTIGYYAAQGARGLLGFTKDALVGVGELAYEGSKLAFDAQQAMLTPAGIQSQILDAQILLENIRLGNVTTGTMTSGAANTATNVGKAIVAPVIDAWAKGQYVESVTRATVEIATLPFVALKSSKAVKTGDAISNAANANKAVDVASETSSANKATNTTNTQKASESTEPKGDGGKVEKKQKPKRKRPEPNAFDAPDGYKTHGIIEGEKLYKVVPEGIPPGKYSAYFGTKDEIASMKGLSYDEISDRLGIPRQSQQTTRFDIVIGLSNTEQVGHSKNTQVQKNTTFNTGENLILEAGKSITLKVGKSMLVMDSEGKITLLGSNITLEASGPLQITGKDIDLN